MVCPYCLDMLLNVVPCPKSTPLLEDWEGMAKLLLRFTAWPLDILLLLVQNFMVFGCCPVQSFELYGILIHVVTSTLFRSVTEHRVGYLASQSIL